MKNRKLKKGLTIKEEEKKKKHLFFPQRGREQHAN